MENQRADIDRPLDRLKELAAEGVIGGIPETHYTVMGSSDPAPMKSENNALKTVGGRFFVPVSWLPA